MADIWQLHSRLGIAVEIPHLILGVLKDKAMFSVKPQGTQGMRKERKKEHVPLAPRQDPLSREVSALPVLGESMGDSGVCSKCHFHFILCFPDLQCRVHLLDSQPTQQPYKLCSCWIWSECTSFLFGNSSGQWQPCKAEGGSHWDKTCFCDTDIFEAAWLRHALMWLVPPIKIMFFLSLHTSCHLLFLELDLTKFHSAQPE